MTTEKIIRNFKQVLPVVDWWSLRLVFENEESLRLRQGVLQPPHLTHSQGAHITVCHRGGMAYAATCELTPAGFRRALAEALEWALSTRDWGLFDADRFARPSRSGHYRSPVESPWDSASVGDKIDRLRGVSDALKVSDTIVDWQVELTASHVRTLLLTSDDVEIEQDFSYLLPGYMAVANKGAQTQTRSGGGWGNVRQGGLEQLSNLGFDQDAQRVAEEAAALVDAPECPDANMSVLLMPSQMTLQIHESIGHPLELDRILGDERNYAGTSFVTLDMFGSYRYGSRLLNITYDPTWANEAASYAFDDEGTPAEREFLIRDGILERPLGGALSQSRAGTAGVANSRACSWNRPPIDRMANLNLEPGEHPFDQLVASIERGVLMDTNRSWSIDDSRNKFQFGCELGRLIQDGELKGVVRNPNYRGISANFWRNLVAVGDGETFEVGGTPYCGKGEPNQAIAVGHASPACVFQQVDVFGGL